MRWPLWRVAVAEHSMQPALRPGDWLLVWRGMPVSRQARFSRPARSGHSAAPGKTAREHQLAASSRPLSIKPGQVVVARHPDRAELLLVKRAVRRVPGGWWLLSDNPDAGTVDSRRFGPVAPELIEGRVLARYWPARRR